MSTKLSTRKKYHLHENESGRLVKCYHDTKELLLSWQFWVGTLIAFPIEHGIWEFVPPFSYITHWVGL